MYELQVANMRSDAVRFTSRRFEMLDARGHVTVEQGSGAQDEGGGVASPGGTLSLSRLFFFPQPPPPPPPPPPGPTADHPQPLEIPPGRIVLIVGRFDLATETGNMGVELTLILGSAGASPHPVSVSITPPKQYAHPLQYIYDACFFDFRHRISGLLPLSFVVSMSAIESAGSFL